MRPLLSFFAVLAVGLPCVSACPPVCRYSTPYRAPVVHDVYVAPLAAVYVPVAVPVPTFTVGYAPAPLLSTALSGAGGPQPGLAPPAVLPGASPAATPGVTTGPPAGAESRLDRLERENAELRRQLAPTPAEVAPVASGGDYVPTKPGDKTLASPGLALVGNWCAKCHEAAVAKEKGKGVVLVQGNRLAPLTAALRRKATLAVANGEMPKGATLADREIAQLLDVFAEPTEPRTTP